MRKRGQVKAAIFNLTQDICGEARIVERAFGIGVGALTEAEFCKRALALESQESGTT